MMLATLLLVSLSLLSRAQGGSELAVAIPFHISQFETRLLPTMRTWNLRPPCIGQAQQPVTLVFVCTGEEGVDPDPEGLGSRVLPLKQALQKAWAEQHAAQSCFGGGMRLLMIPLAAEHDNYSDAPCLIFTGMLDGLRALGFQHVFQMESDVQPVKAGWVEALLAEARANHQMPVGSRWWQLGSSAQCQTAQGRLDVRNDLHINGNSLWQLEDDGLWEYIERVKRFLPAGAHSGVNGCGTGAWAEVGVDHAMYRFRVHPLNWEYSRNVIHKFQYTQLIVNKCEDRYDVGAIQRSLPHTYLIHSKSVFLASAELLARESSVMTLNQWPDSTMQRALKSQIVRAKWDSVKLEQGECVQAPLNESMPCVRCSRVCAFLRCQYATKSVVNRQVNVDGQWSE